MINKTDLVAGTLLSSQLPTLHKTSIMCQLEELFTLKGDPLSFRDQVVEQSKDPEFIALAEEVAKMIGDELHTSSVRIKEHVIPLLGEIAAKVKETVSINSVLEKTVRHLKIRYSCIEDSFFDSTLYPNGTKGTSLSYATFKLDDKSFPSGMLENTEISQDVLKGFMVNHPDINHLFSDVDDVSEAIHDIHSYDFWAKTFTKNGIDCDFNRVDCFESRKLFRIYIVLSKLRASETLLFPVKNISLEQYKTLINELWEGMNVYLTTYKIVCRNYAQDGLTILKGSEYRLIDAEVDDVKMRLLQGDCHVLYTRNFNNLLDEQNLSLPEIAYNYILHSIKSGGRPQLSPMAFINHTDKRHYTEPTEMSELLRENTRSCSNYLAETVRGVARVVIGRKLTEMGLENPNLETISDSFYCFIDVNNLEAKNVDIDSAIFNSQLGHATLCLIGWKNAAKLLRLVQYEMEDEVPKTKAMARAYAIFAVDYLTRRNEALEE